MIDTEQVLNQIYDRNSTVVWTPKIAINNFLRHQAYNLAPKLATDLIIPADMVEPIRNYKEITELFEGGNYDQARAILSYLAISDNSLKELEEALSNINESWVATCMDKKRFITPEEMDALQFAKYAPENLNLSDTYLNFDGLAIVVDEDEVNAIYGFMPGEGKRIAWGVEYTNGEPAEKLAKEAFDYAGVREYTLIHTQDDNFVNYLQERFMTATLAKHELAKQRVGIQNSASPADSEFRQLVRN